MFPMHPELPLHLVLIGILAACCVTDLKSRRIPNIITAPTMIVGLAYHGMIYGLDGLAFAGLGLVLGLAVMLVPFLIGLMGAGDVKLMAAAGAILGPNALLDAFLITSLYGGIYALVVLAMNRGYLKRVFLAIRDSLFFFMSFRKFSYVQQDTQSALPRLCYGVAIAAGTMTTMALSLYDRGIFSGVMG
jgi:prepilin peptidase CpaA